jgi:hypothetical protein
MKTKILLWIKTTWDKGKKTLIKIGLFLLVLIIAYIAGRCSTKEIRDNQVHNLIAARDSVKHSLVTIDGLKNSVWEKNAIILGQEQSIDAGLIREELLKKLHIKDLITNAELSGVIQRQDSLLSLPPKTEYITIKDSSGIKKNYVRYPFQLLKLHDNYLSLDAGLDSLRKAWYKLNVPFDGTVSVGYKKTGFLKTTPVGIFTSTNPHIQVNKMDVLIVKEQEKWFQKWYVHAIAGAVAIETARILIK